MSVVTGIKKNLINDYFSKRQTNSGNNQTTITSLSSIIQSSTTITQIQGITTNSINHNISNVCNNDQYTTTINPDITTENSDQTKIDNNSKSIISISSNSISTSFDLLDVLDVADPISHILSIDPENILINENIELNRNHKKSKPKKSTHQSTLPEEIQSTEAWGGSINSKAPKTFRIYFQNVNSIRVIDETGGKWNSALKYMQSKECEIFGSAETCTNWKDDITRKKFNKIAQEQFGFTNRIIHSQNKFNIHNRTATVSKSNYQPGGTMQIVTDHWASRIIEEFHDPRQMGRWCGQKLRTNKNTTLTIITAYRPCRHQSSNSSTSKATSSQQIVMLKEQGIELEPRKVFVNDLIELINTQENIPNNHVIVMMDANESLDEKSSDIHRLIRDTTLIDAFTHSTGIECNIPTYIRGRK